MASSKKSETFNAKFVTKFTELVWGLFLSEITSTRFFTIKSFESILSLYDDACSCQKLEKFHALIICKTQKASTWAQSGSKTFQTKFFPKKSLKSILNLYAILSSRKKSEKLHALI